MEGGVILFALIVLVLFASWVVSVPNTSRKNQPLGVSRNEDLGSSTSTGLPLLRLFAAPLIVGWTLVRLGLVPSESACVGLYGTGIATTFVGLLLVSGWEAGAGRRLRYEIVLYGLSAIWLVTFVNPTGVFGSHTHVNTRLLLMILPSATFLLALPISHFIRVLPHRVTPEGRRLPGKTIQTWYRFLQPVGVALGAVSVMVLPVGLVIIYLLLRFHVGQRMEEVPYLYLRSFSQEGVAKAFAKIVGPALAGSGFVVGLAHTTQPALAVNRRVNTLYRARLHLVPDDQWRQWVDAQLRVCPAVVLDMTTTTPGVRWELERALELVPAERIAVLVVDEEIAGLPDDVTVIVCRPGFWERRNAARKLKRWIRWVRIFA